MERLFKNGTVAACLMGTGVLAVALSASVVQAEVPSFHATVPFSFVVGNQTMPAGTYVVQRYLGQAKDPDTLGVIVMKISDRHVYKVMLTGTVADRSAERGLGSGLIFTTFEGKQYLNRVRLAGDTVVHQLANVPPEIRAQGTNGEVIVVGFRYSRGK